MCQLTFINTSDAEFNLKFLLNQYLINTTVTHKDGWGFFTPSKGIFKTSLHPWQTLNLGRVLSQRIIEPEPIIAHVRLASLCHNKKEVKTENAHPFESEDFVLAHNGTFEGDIIDDERFKDKIDTEIFLTVLQETYDRFPKKKIAKLIDEVYTEHFTGKFALLIYFKPKNRFFVVRGTSALLYKIDIYEGEDRKKAKKVGFIINTDKADLEKAFIWTCNDLQISGKNYFMDEPVLLQLNTVFIVNSTFLREIGNIKEIKKEEYSFWRGNPNNNRLRGRNTGGATHPQVGGTGEKEVDFLLRLFDDYKLSAPEIDTFFLELTGYATICAKKEDFSLFKEMSEPFLDFYTEHKGNLWKKLVTAVGGDGILAYDIYDLQFPYFLNEAKVLNDVWIEVKKGDIKFDEKDEMTHA